MKWILDAMPWLSQRSIAAPCGFRVPEIIRRAKFPVVSAYLDELFVNGDVFTTQSAEGAAQVGALCRWVGFGARITHIGGENSSINVRRILVSGGGNVIIDRVLEVSDSACETFDVTGVRNYTVSGTLSSTE